MKNSASATATATLVTYADADGIDYNYEYDLVAPTVIPYFGFDLTPCHGIVPDHLCVPTGTYVVSTNAAEPITRHGAAWQAPALPPRPPDSSSTTPTARAGASR